MARGETYEEFVNKFKAKKTTDDCYTPPALYADIAEWAMGEYGIEKEKIIRPFYPGGDYQAEDYDGKVVLDNPPFSILSEIIDFYDEHHISYFLFMPGRIFSKKAVRNHLLVTGGQMVAANGAAVSINFVTSFGPRPCIETVPELYAILKKHLPRKSKRNKHILPDVVITGSKAAQWAELGIATRLTKYIHKSALEEQKSRQMGIFGGGVLIGKRMAQKLKARENKAQALIDAENSFRWGLSKGEKAMVANLD